MSFDFTTMRSFTDLLVSKAFLFQRKFWNLLRGHGQTVKDQSADFEIWSLNSWHAIWGMNIHGPFLIVLEFRKWKLRRLQKKYCLTIWVVLWWCDIFWDSWYFIWSKLSPHIALAIATQINGFNKFLNRCERLINVSLMLLWLRMFVRMKQFHQKYHCHSLLCASNEFFDEPHIWEI